MSATVNGSRPEPRGLTRDQLMTAKDYANLVITYRKDRANAGEVLGALTADGLHIVDVSTRDPDLEDVFLSLVAEG